MFTCSTVLEMLLPMLPFAGTGLAPPPPLLSLNTSLLFNSRSPAPNDQPSTQEVTGGTCTATQMGSLGHNTICIHATTFICVCP